MEKSENPQPFKITVFDKDAIKYLEVYLLNNPNHSNQSVFKEGIIYAISSLKYILMEEFDKTKLEK